MYYCRFLLVADITRKKLAHPFQGDYEEKSHEKLHLFIALKFEKPLEFEWGYRYVFAFGDLIEVSSTTNLTDYSDLSLIKLMLNISYGCFFITNARDISVDNPIQVIRIKVYGWR